jgi:hypothetical protein
MISACILLLCIGAASQFVLAYCRTLLLTYEKVSISPSTLEVTGYTGESWQPQEFDRLMGLARIAPNLLDDASEIRAVTAYYSVVNFAGSMIAPFSSAAREWVQQELSRCTYFAAVTLDRRLAPLIN